MKPYLLFALFGIFALSNLTCKKCTDITKIIIDTVYQKSSPSGPQTDTLKSDAINTPGTTIVNLDNIVRDTTFEMNSLAWTDNGALLINRSLFTFDLSSIPTGAIVDSAILSLYHDSISTSIGNSTESNSNASVIQRITTSWDPLTTVWSNQPLTDTTDEAPVAESTSQYEDYPHIIVTALVQDMVNNPATSFGFMLRLDSEQPYCSLLFCSARYYNPARRPKLMVTFTPK